MRANYTIDYSFIGLRGIDSLSSFLHIGYSSQELLAVERAVIQFSYCTVHTIDITSTIKQAHLFPSSQMTKLYLVTSILSITFKGYVLNSHR